jgi:hypothetical protein
MFLKLPKTKNSFPLCSITAFSSMSKDSFPIYVKRRFPSLYKNSCPSVHENNFHINAQEQYSNPYTRTGLLSMYNLSNRCTRTDFPSTDKNGFTICVQKQLPIYIQFPINVQEYIHHLLKKFHQFLVVTMEIIQ